VRTARQAIGMDLRTFSERIKEAGRAVSTSALSKIENGDRRVDVDDLTVFAYVLQTTPAALLIPSGGASPPTGVPNGQFNQEEIQAWVRGQAKFTIEDLARYWKDEYFSAVSSLRYYENLMLQYTEDGKGNQVHRGTYEERSVSFRARRDDTADGWA
jgi:transcriptional regulator with XRE-family HTH domain